MLCWMMKHVVDVADDRWTLRVIEWYLLEQETNHSTAPQGNSVTGGGQQEVFTLRARAFLVVLTMLISDLMIELSV